MKLAISVMCIVSFAAERGARANCDKAPPRAATLDVYECDTLAANSDTSLENNAEGHGVLVKGAVTWKLGGSQDNLQIWVPASEMLGCSKLAGPGLLIANIEKVCCEPNTGPVCEAGANAVVSSAKLIQPTPAKKATRAQLENEVEKLRSENARLRAEVFKMRAQIQAENERLQQEIKVLDKKLK